MFTRQTEQTRQLRLSISQTTQCDIVQNSDTYAWSVFLSWMLVNPQSLFYDIWYCLNLNTDTRSGHNMTLWPPMARILSLKTVWNIQIHGASLVERRATAKETKNNPQCLTDCQSEFLSKIMHVWIDQSCFLFVQAAMLERQMRNKTCYQVVKYMKESNNNGISLLLAVNPFRYPKINIPIRHTKILKYTTKFQVLTKASGH